MRDRLEIGSGTRPRLGFDHCDINPELPDLQYVLDMDNLHEIPDNSYGEVWTTHVIEHVSIARARIALKEWYRILRPGGMCHIDTPNIERNMRMYQDGTWVRDFNSLTPGEQAYCSLNGEPNKTLWLNFKIFSSDAQWDVHFANYDANLLADLCYEAGFREAIVHQTEPSLIIRAIK
jgi:SAM-dependent methyltransferase